MLGLMLVLLATLPFFFVGDVGADVVRNVEFDGVVDVCVNIAKDVGVCVVIDDVGDLHVDWDIDLDVDGDADAHIYVVGGVGVDVDVALDVGLDDIVGVDVVDDVDECVWCLS